MNIYVFVFANLSKIAEIVSESLFLLKWKYWVSSNDYWKYLSFFLCIVAVTASWSDNPFGIIDVFVIFWLFFAFYSTVDLLVIMKSE